MAQTFPEALFSLTDDWNGTISWQQAESAAALHKMTADFWADYGHLKGERIDTGELLVWMGY